MPLRLDYQPGGSDAEWDLSVEDGHLATEGGMTTAIVVSLFTWGRASADQLRAYGFRPEDNQGSWQDSFPLAQGDREGSLLWLLARAKKNDETLLAAQTFARAALRWLLDDGVCRRIDTSAYWIEHTDILALRVVLTRADGTRWAGVWAAISGETLEPLQAA